MQLKKKKKREKSKREKPAWNCFDAKAYVMWKSKQKKGIMKRQTILKFMPWKRKKNSEIQTKNLILTKINEVPSRPDLQAELPGCLPTSVWVALTSTTAHQYPSRYGVVNPYYLKTCLPANVIWTWRNQFYMSYVQAMKKTCTSVCQ